MKRLTLFQMNDSHAYFEPHQEMFLVNGQESYRLVGGYARIAAVLRKAREASPPGSVLFMDCGDTLHGTYPALQTRGMAMVPVMNELAPTAMTLHWEYAYGPKRVAELVEHFDFPVVAANIYDKESGELVFAPYLVGDYAGVRVGIIGLASNIIDKTMPPNYSEGLRFTIGEEETAKHVAHLRSEEKVDLIILLSHLGFPQEMKLLEAVPDIDVCLSGHTHNRLREPVIAGKTIVFQSGCHGSFLGRLDLELEGGKILRHRHELIEIGEDLPADPAMEKIIAKELAPYRDVLAEVVGETASPLNRYRMNETCMDNFMLKAVIEASDAEIAFSNGWRYAAPIVPGLITLNDLYNMIPMDPPIFLVEIRGGELLDMLEENLERTFSRDPYEQMGGYIKRAMGLQMRFKVENPKGTRLQQVFINGSPLDRDAVYTAASVTAQGIPNQYGSNRRTLDIRTVQAMRDYLALHGPLSIELEDNVLAV